MSIKELSGNEEQDAISSINSFVACVNSTVYPTTGVSLAEAWKMSYALVYLYVVEIHDHDFEHDEFKECIENEIYNVRSYWDFLY